ncbi:SDR family NAD(P)-dependent oxidoreductase [Glutamicibacter sp.]|uniref:SDR family NAD(P)-dependent oxidoreductase n=1 Tax=Glutamicibacter sp. TaxID=1931995 RepID=UPI002FE04547
MLHPNRYCWCLEQGSQLDNDRREETTTQRSRTAKEGHEQSYRGDWCGLIGQVIARRFGAGQQVLLADISEQNARSAAQVLADAGFETSTAVVDVSSRESVHALVETTTDLGDVTGVIHAAGVSASQASIQQILAVDLYGTALVLE